MPYGLKEIELEKIRLLFAKNERIESVIFTLLIALSSVTAQNIDDVVYTFDKNVPSYMSIKDIDSILTNNITVNIIK